MTAKPDIAVLMPCYNPGTDIDVTLASLRAQTIPFKLFVIDDGSPRKPDYRVLLDGFDFYLIELPNNVGVNEVRNPGLAKILEEGFKFIALIDCGDAMAPERLATQKEYLDNHPEIAIAGSWIALSYKESGRNIEVQWPVEHEGIESGMWFNMSVTHPALMVRSEVYRNIGFYRKDYEAAEDYDMCRRALGAGFRFHNIDRVLLHKYETKDSISWRKRRAQLHSRWRLLWDFRDLAEPRCYLGLAKTAAIIALPDGLVPKVKALLGRP